MAKYLEVARKIREAIRSGQWSEGRLPGIRKLAEEFFVSPMTAVRAVQLLRDEKVLRTVGRSGCYVTDQDNPSADLGLVLVLHTTPGPWQNQVARLTSDGFEAVAVLENCRMLPETTLDPKASEATLRKQVRLARASGVRGVFLLPARADAIAGQNDERFVSICRSSGMAVVLIERNFRGSARPLECDLVTGDDVRGGAACTRHLFELGRKSLAFVTGSPISSHDHRLAGFLLTHHEFGRQPVGILTQSTAQTASDAYRDLVDQLFAVRADGVVCYQDYVAVGLILECLRRGARVPEDIAVTGYDDLPIGSAFSLGLTTWSYPSLEMARSAIRLVKERLNRPADPPRQVVCPGHLIIRESSQGMSHKESR